MELNEIKSTKIVDLCLKNTERVCWLSGHCWEIHAPLKIIQFPDWTRKKRKKQLKGKKWESVNLGYFMQAPFFPAMTVSISVERHVY